MKRTRRAERIVRFFFFFFSSRRRHTRLQGDWSSDVCSSDLAFGDERGTPRRRARRTREEPLSVMAPAACFALGLMGKESAIVLVALVLLLEIGRASCRERV